MDAATKMETDFVFITHVIIHLLQFVAYTSGTLWRIAHKFRDEEGIRLENILRFEVPAETKYFLDCSEQFEGEPTNSQTIFFNDFENDTLATDSNAINGKRSLYFSSPETYSPDYLIPVESENKKWLRVSALFRINEMEWNDWNMTVIYVSLWKNGKEIKSNMLRVQHVMKNDETKKVFVDMKLPDTRYDHVKIVIAHGNGWTPVWVDNLKAEIF